RRLFECKVSVQIRLRGLNRLMAEPKSDHGAVDACLQQLHRSGVPQNVRRYPLGTQRRTALTGDTHMLGQKRLDAVSTKPAPMHVGEQCPRLISYRFL